MEAHSDYYAPILQAEKATKAEALKELEMEMEKEKVDESNSVSGPTVTVGDSENYEKKGVLTLLYMILIKGKLWILEIVLLALILTTLIDSYGSILESITTFDDQLIDSQIFLKTSQLGMFDLMVSDILDVGVWSRTDLNSS
nr:glutamic acid-rich protein-like [Ipomoea batatas]GMC55422.1 glutamic acid-rich protein-like [Ipomoea batatas]